eukprot:CAMPEP_0197860082 /NCGR_PEP_ID=MMETSP1438-20131217/35220_1 /TAXON_ID=1461541 /ORGANISM="Pterosperma sp., Strain CCMP1384" /LENGTH=83 /DNA_ID=CAMNT_0043476829 /DNA_START=251 /DNA_END=502 /DNA_ORIENTATION=+
MAEEYMYFLIFFCLAFGTPPLVKFISIVQGFFTNDSKVSNDDEEWDFEAEFKEIEDAEAAAAAEEEAKAGKKKKKKGGGGGGD